MIRNENKKGLVRCFDCSSEKRIEHKEGSPLMSACPFFKGKKMVTLSKRLCDYFFKKNR